MSGLILPSLVGPRLENDATNDVGPNKALKVAPTAKTFLHDAGAPMVENPLSPLFPALATSRRSGCSNTSLS